MTPVTSLSPESVDDLIRKLEEATGPNFRLEQEIMWAVQGVKPEHQHPDDKPPLYTVSLDAAMTLAERKGWRWLLDKRPAAELRHDGYRAQVYREAHPYKSDMSDMPTAWAKTAALALCIAALKSLSASPDKG